MAGEWEAKSLGDLAELHDEQINPGDWPDRVFRHFSIPAFDSGRVPVIELGASIGSHKFTVPPDSILLSRLNPRIPRVWEPNVAGDGTAICSTEFLVLRPRSGMERRFLKYACLSPTLRAEMQARVTGTSGSHQRVRPEDAMAIEIEVPVDVTEQRAIAHILGTLDDKIELNRRMSETLEAMARALFKSWFVDFEPVRAKLEGRWRRGQSLPGLPAHLYDLFPDRLVDSELGEIPEGWGVQTFGDIAKQLRETENPLESPDVVFRHFSIPAYDDGQWPKHEAGENIKSLKSRVPPGVVLLSKLNPEIERVWLVDVQPDERAICSTEFIVLSPRPPYGRSLLYCLARSQSFRNELEGLVTGTSKSHQRAHVEAILELAVVRPAEPLLNHFENTAETVLTRTLECRRESRTLAALRDALLPKLISGELRVRDAEKFIGRAV
jgi:type I restriction enzyme S subunit